MNLGNFSRVSHTSKIISLITYRGIIESQKIMDKPQEAKLLADHYDLSSLPEVVAIMGKNLLEFIT